MDLWEKWQLISEALGIPFITVAMWLMVAALNPENDERAGTTGSGLAFCLIDI